MANTENQGKSRIPAFASSLVLQHATDSEANVACDDVSFEESRSILSDALNSIKVVAKFLLTDPLPVTLSDILDRKYTEQPYKLVLINQAGQSIWTRNLILTASSVCMSGSASRRPPRTRRAEGEAILNMYREGSPRWQWFMQQSGEMRDILANISQRVRDSSHFPEMRVTFHGRLQDTSPPKEEPARMTLSVAAVSSQVPALYGSVIRIQGSNYKLVLFRDIPESSELYLVGYRGSIYTARLLSVKGDYLPDAITLCKLVKTADGKAYGDTGGSYSSLGLGPDDEVLIACE